MQRLLREADFVFLAYHPGYSPEIGRQLRRRRVKILRKYLDQLAAEFERLHLSLRLLTLHAAYDRPEIVRELLLQRLVFTRCLFEVRLRLALFGFGLKPVHAGTLVESLHRMQSQVELLSRSLQANQARTWSVSS
ncbi:MAG: hypothetical protein NZV14_06595 [Bryobacteraceae bacterium]|nr:hypothetical protein [Bryobacteraceae bacterium]MDW8377812.1 hypothetical protein [Bryobacterales bacterium]